MYQRILVPTDGSALSKKAVNTAIALAKLCNAELVALKVVDKAYPLRGQLTVADAPDSPGARTREVPAPGEVWVDPQLLDGLALGVGDTLLLGDARLRISRIIVLEPDRGGGFH